MNCKPDNVVPMLPAMNEKITLTLRDIAGIPAFTTEQNGQRVRNGYAFRNALEKLGTDPTPGTDIYWVSRLLRKVESAIKSFEKANEVLVSKHGTKLSAMMLEEYRGVDSESPQGKNLSNNMSTLALHPQRDVSIITQDNKAAYEAELETLLDQDSGIEWTKLFTVHDGLKMTAQEKMMLHPIINPPVE